MLEPGVVAKVRVVGDNYLELALEAVDHVEYQSEETLDRLTVRIDLVLRQALAWQGVGREMRLRQLVEQQAQRMHS